MKCKTVIAPALLPDELVGLPTLKEGKTVYLKPQLIQFLQDGGTLLVEDIEGAMPEVKTALLVLSHIFPIEFVEAENIIVVLGEAGAVMSSAEGRRILHGGGIKLNEQPLVRARFTPREGDVLTVGKRTKLTRKNGIWEVSIKKRS